MSAFYTAVARYYDAENIDKTDDLALYSRLARTHPGAILDVGCGTGRILIHLARQGHRVHGIDNDSAMLARLESKLAHQPQLREKLTYTQGDAKTHAFERQFSLVLLSYNALMHFAEQSAQLALLRNLRACLADGGCLAIDLPNPAPAFAADDTGALTWEREFLDPDSGNLVMLQSVSWLDRAAQLLDVDWVYDAMDGDGVVRRLIARHRLRYFFLAELRLLLAQCGFQLDKAYGDCDGNPYDADSERLIVLARQGREWQEQTTECAERAVIQQ